MPYRKPMKKKSKGMLAAVCLAYGLCQLSVPMTAWGATKPISTVTIKVKSKLEPGMHLPDINIDGSSSDGEVLVSESDNKYDVFPTDRRPGTIFPPSEMIQICMIR